MKRNNKLTDQRILLYKERNASECMNAAFDFMRQNWHILLRYSLYVLLPICIIQTVGVVSVAEGILAQVSEPPMLRTGRICAAQYFVVDHGQTLS